MVEDKFGIVPTPQSSNQSVIGHFSDGKLMHFSRGETILNGIDEPEGVFLIKEGFIKAHSVSDAGHGNLLLIHQTGEFVPLPWALDGPHVTGLYYEALDDVTVLRVSKDRLRSSMGSNSWLAQEVMKQAVTIIAVYTQRIQALEFRTARGRIIAEMIALAERFGKHQSNGILIYAPVTHQEIADSINMTRETASRALELLFEEKLMWQNDDNLFIVSDLDKLRAVLS